MVSKYLAIWVALPYQRDALFDPASSLNRDSCLAPFRVLREKLAERGWECHTQDVYLKGELVPEAVLSLDIPPVPVNKLLGAWAGKVRKYVLLQECEVVLPRNWDKKLHAQFDAVFAWSPALVDGRRYFRVNFANTFPANARVAEQPREKFCAMIAAHKRKSHPLELYSEREKTVRWFEANHPGEFDLYGVGWDRHTFSGPLFIRALNRLGSLTRLLAPHFSSYRGAVVEKRPVLEKYKFAICYENARDIPGYITEKVFDCFFAGCVPVYWGAPDIAENVPPECFIDRRDFKTHEELYAFMKGMSAADYAVKRQAISDYLSSEKSYPFTDKCFVETLAGRILA